MRVGLKCLGKGIYEAGVRGRGNCVCFIAFCRVVCLGIELYSWRTLLKFISSITLLKLVVDCRSVVV